MGGRVPIEHQCLARTRAGEPCHAAKIRGAARCGKHGGLTSPAKNRKRLALAQTQKDVARYGLSVETTPADALQDELNRTNGAVLFLETVVRGMGAEELITRMKKETRVGKLDSYISTTVEAAVAVWAELYILERKHLARIADSMVKNGLAAVQIAINAEVVGIFDRTMTGILEDLGISTADPQVRRVIVSRMDEAHQESQQQVQMTVVR